MTERETNFVPIPAHCRVDSVNSSTATLHLWFDETFENDVDSLHREDLVIFTQKQWDAIKAELATPPAEEE
jgi:hypothetical protein